LRVWARERFSAGATVTLLAVSQVAVCHGRALTHGGAVPPVAATLAAFAGLWGFFLMLRVIDEHKDFRRDHRDHPGRALQRGVVSLAELRAVGAFGFGLQLGASLSAGQRAVAWWVLALGWTALAARDFFLGDHVADRPVLYPLLHLPLSAVPCLWAAQVGAGDRPLPAAAVWTALLGVGLAGAADLARKFAPEPGGRGRSYVGALGEAMAAAVLCGSVVLVAVVLYAVARTGTGHSLLPALVLGILTLPVLVMTARPGAHRPLATGRYANTASLVLLAQLSATAGLLVTGEGRP
jgi:4-hydroxybenzoate polyprenyltransferase